MVKTVTILIPVAELDVKEIPMNSRTNDLNGKIVGFLWNGKPNGDFLLNRIKELLLQRFKLVRTTWEQVEALHVLAEDAQEVKRIADTSDIAVLATGD